MPKCDTSKALVALDGAMALTAGLVAAAIADNTEPAVALLPLSIGAIYLGGAVRGNSNVNKCRAAMMDFERYTDSLDTPGARRDDVAISDDEKRGMHPQLDAAVQPHTELIKPPAVAPAPAPAPAPTETPPAPAPVVSPAAKAPAPTPAARPPATKAASKPAPKPTDDWADFWREVD
jgi:hypothetical protein